VTKVLYVEDNDDNVYMLKMRLELLGDFEVLLRILYLSLDPYMRGRMNATKSYAKPAAIGQPMVGGTVGEIVNSRHPNFSVGDVVLGYGGWQEYAISNGKGLRKLDPTIAPVSTALGVLGMLGRTAYVGLLEVGQPKPDETVVVAAASGAVGSVVGQIAKLKGCHAVGIAGGSDKCRFVTGELSFDACVDHRSPDFAKELEAACLSRGRPLMPRASKRGPPNNGNLPRAGQNHARSRFESAGAARHETAHQASRECPGSREAIGSSSGWQMRESRKQ